MILVLRGVAWREGVEWYERSGWQNLRGRKINTSKEKKNYFLRLQNFKFMRQIKGNSIIMIFLRYKILVRGGHCNYSPEAPKPLAMPLFVLTLG